jgi:hypothetical protein
MNLIKHEFSTSIDRAMKEEKKTVSELHWSDFYDVVVNVHSCKYCPINFITLRVVVTKREPFLQQQEATEQAKKCFLLFYGNKLM